MKNENLSLDKNEGFNSFFRMKTSTENFEKRALNCLN